VRFRWIALIAALAFAVVAIDTVFGVHALGRHVVQVTARLVDDATGQPASGVSVVMGRDRGEAADPGWAAGQRQFHAQVPGIVWRTAVGISGHDGSIDLKVEVSRCRHIGLISGLIPRSLPTYYGVERLLLEGEGYARSVVDGTKGRWTAHAGKGDDPDATLDLGEVRLKR
jgi:hypothetical protein